MTFSPPPVVLFVCDLDGLGAASAQAWSALHRTVAEFERAGVRIVLWSSATVAELIALARTVDLVHPFFAENGSALVIPERYFASVPIVALPHGDHRIIEFGCGRAHAQRELCRLGARHGVTVQWERDPALPLLQSLPRVRRDTPARIYDQPFRIVGGDLHRLRRLWRSLCRAGLRWTQSSHCDHVNGVVDPRVGLAMLRWLYEAETDRPVAVLGLGRTQNHLPLLREADAAIIAPHPRPGLTTRLQRLVPKARLVGLPRLQQDVLSVARSLVCP